jgi:hypothetical protein
MESINDGDVDHDLENEETQITDTPGKYLVWKVHHSLHSVELCFKVLAHQQRYNKKIVLKCTVILFYFILINCLCIFSVLSWIKYEQQNCCNLQQNLISPHVRGNLCQHFYDLY